MLLRQYRRSLAAIIVASTLLTEGVAYHLPGAGTYANIISTEKIDNDGQKQAEALQRLGLFSGTEKGLELFRVTTRAEAAVMLVRFLGAEQEAIAGTWQTPFLDIPEWAAPYIGWLYEKGYTKGIAAKQYGANQNMSGIQFATLLSRILMGTEDYLQSGVLTNLELQGFVQFAGTGGYGDFRRVEAVGMLVRALMLPQAPDGATLAQQLVSKGVFSAAQLKDAFSDIIPAETYYDAGVICSSIAGVEIARCPIKNLHFDTGMGDNDHPYLYAYKVDTAGFQLYYLDCLTLEPVLLWEDATAQGEAAENCFIARLWQKNDMPTIDYLLEQWKDPSGNIHIGAVLTVENGQVHPVLESGTLSDLASVLPPRFIWEKYEAETANFGIQDGNKLYVIYPDQTVIKEGIQGEVLYRDASRVVSQEVTRAGTILRNLDTDTMQIIDEYHIPLYEENKPRTVQVHDIWLYGSGGLYSLGIEKGLEAEKRLWEISQLPIQDVVITRWGAGPSDPYVITYLNQDPTQQQILLLSEGQEMPLLSSAQSGLLDLRFEDSFDSIILLSARNGKDAGRFFYYYLPGGEPSLHLVYDHETNQYAQAYLPDEGVLDDAQAKPIVQVEQIRLYQLGIGSIPAD